MKKKEMTIKEQEDRISEIEKLVKDKDQTILKLEQALLLSQQQQHSLKKSSRRLFSALLRKLKYSPRDILRRVRGSHKKKKGKISDYQIISRSNLFDREWYLKQNPDLNKTHIDPVAHYLHHGAFEGRAPSKHFDSAWYLEQNPDVDRSNMNPLLHYIKVGRNEGRLSQRTQKLDKKQKLKGFSPIMLANKRYRKYLSSSLLLLFSPILSGQFIDRMEKRKKKNAVSKSLLKKTAVDTRYTLQQEELFEELFAHSSNLSDEYVPQSHSAIGEKSRIKTIAFYLPQFHPIAENDKWWGKGFTEWTNVSKAVPQFSGHYQPKLPGELGFYDLRIPDVMKRQIELAKHYGIYGFCFHYYWFSGRKRLLELPLNNYLTNKELDLPFCICWANENWTRRWDGMENEVLMEQRYEAQDDLQFIEDLAPVLKDSRYIKVNGRPLIIVYRINQLPNPKKTINVWREYCVKEGIGEPWVVAAQSFDIRDPRLYGCDAAVEFPPHNTDNKEITDLNFYNLNYEGQVWSYESIIQKDKEFSWPEYELYKTVFPSWDNEARRPGRGSSFVYSSPTLYQKWLTSVCKKTDFHKSQEDSKFVFINAWNEWAEGAYLEPDRRYGYAYLQATKEVLTKFPEGGNNSRKQSNTAIQTSRKIALISHDAYPHGAQYLTLNLARLFSQVFNYEVEIILLGNGPLEQEFKKYGNVHNLANKDQEGPEACQLVKTLSGSGIRAAIVNTTVSGLFTKTLKQEGLHVTSLVHELPEIIKSYKLEAHVKTISQNSDKIVFAAKLVEEGCKKFSNLDARKVEIKPQGLYKKPLRINSKKIKAARYQLRNSLNIELDTKIILGVGYADKRKGVDLFVDTAISICRDYENAVFVWVGHFDSNLERQIRNRISKAGLSTRVLLPGRKTPNEVNEYYAGSDIYLLTSREDPFPSVVLEALDANLPVVAFDKVTGSSDLISRTGSYLVQPFNLQALTQAIENLLINPIKAHEIGSCGKSIMSEEFSFRRYAFELIEFSNTSLKRVSVIVPNYNHLKYLEERLRSIQKQDYPIYEVIILDDASTDNSAEWLSENIDDILPNARLILNTQNSGNVWLQWMKGVNAATGDFIWIAESDDNASPQFLGEVLKGFDHPDVVLSYCQSRQMDENGQITANDYLNYVNDLSTDKWSTSYINQGIEEIRSALSVKNTLPNVSAALFQKSALSKALNNLEKKFHDYNVAGDWLAYIEILQNGSIAFTSESLNDHRRHSSSVTHMLNASKHLQEILQVQGVVKEKFGIENEYKTKALAYAQSVYEYLGINSARFPVAERHPDFSDFIGSYIRDDS